MTEASTPEPLTNPPVPPYTDTALAQNVKDILSSLIEEVQARLNNRKELKKLSTTELLTHIEQIIKATKQPGAVMLVKKAQVSLGEIQDRVKAIDSNPARRKELRESVRNKLRSLPG